MSVPVAWRDDHINFCNKYVLLLGEYIDKQAECTVTGEVLWALKRAIFLRQGVVTGECRRNSGRSGLAGWDGQVTVSRPGDCKLAGPPSVCSQVTASRLVFLASADGVGPRRLTVAVCTPDKLSQCKHSCDSLACRRSASVYVVTR
jgi:hypothetical protein